MSCNLSADVKGSVEDSFTFSLYPELGCLQFPQFSCIWNPTSDSLSHVVLILHSLSNLCFPSFFQIFYLPGKGLYRSWAYCYYYRKERRARGKRALQRWTFYSSSDQYGSNNCRREDHLHLRFSYPLTSSSGRRAVQIENRVTRYW